MRLNDYRKTTLTALTTMAAMVLAPCSNAALVNYSQDFEALHPADAAALSVDGWFIFASVFATDQTSHLYDYGVYAAPNGGAGFSSITAGHGGANQGEQQLTVFSDYNNTDHAAGNWIETLVYQEQTISAADAGTTLSFVFDAKQGSIYGDSSAAAFIKTLDPDGLTTNNILLDTTSLDSEWGTYTLDLLIPADNSLEGQLLQFGFSTFATSYHASDNFYDNINVSVSAVPLPAAAWLFMSGFAALVGLARRKT